MARLQRAASAARSESGDDQPPASTDSDAGKRFPVVRLREGYDITAVDAFLLDIRARSADEIKGVQFPTRRLQQSYDMNAVDAELDRWEKRQRQGD